MPAVGFPSFEQLAIFAAVADAGSFSAAARRLQRAQSVVSYAIGQLEQSLGVPLFDRSGRLPVLTEAGRALLTDARRAGAAVDSLRARATSLQAGLEAELRVGIDVMFPTRRWSPCCRPSPTLFRRSACVCASRRSAAWPNSWQRASVTSGEHRTRRHAGHHSPAADRTRRLVPVAAPECAMAREPFPLAPEVVRDATQIVLTDRTALTRGQDIAVLSLKVWRIGDLGAKHALLRAGLGWGNMPEPLVAEDLATGRLVRLALLEGRRHDYPLSLIQRRDAVLGPAACWLAEGLKAALREDEGPPTRP